MGLGLSPLPWADLLGGRRGSEVLMGSPCPQVPPGAAEEAPGPRGTVEQQGSADRNLHHGVWSPQAPHGLPAWREGHSDPPRWAGGGVEGQTEGWTSAKAEGVMLQGWREGWRKEGMGRWMEAVLARTPAQGGMDTLLALPPAPLWEPRPRAAPALSPGAAALLRAHHLPLHQPLRPQQGRGGRRFQTRAR